MLRSESLQRKRLLKKFSDPFICELRPGNGARGSDRGEHRFAKPGRKCFNRSIELVQMERCALSLSDPGVDDDTDVCVLYEELLMADPSGMEGRPGSADAVRH